MIHRIKITGCLIAITALCAHGATLLGFRYPLGVPIGLGSGMSMSMGGTGVGVSSDNNLMLANPANLGAMSKTVFSSFVSADFVRITETAANQSRHTNHMAFTPSQLSFGFPMGVIGGICIGYERKYDATVRFSYHARPPATDVPSIKSVDFSYSREGGLIAWKAGWGHSIGKWAQIGLSYERLYLAMRSINVVTTYGYQTDLTQDSTGLSMNGNGFGAGIMVPLRHAVLGIAGSYILPADAEAWEVLEGGAAYLNSSSSRFRLQLPPSLSFGASYAITPEWLAATDIKAVLWKYFSSAGNLASGPTSSNAVSFAIGVQYIPSPNLLMPRYWETMQYRAGFHYSQMPVKDAAEWSVSAGIGLPLAAGGGLVDIAIDYGRRTDRSFKSYGEEFVRFGFGINGGRKWEKSTAGNY